jgi:hypothetical protein
MGRALLWGIADVVAEIARILGLFVGFCAAARTKAIAAEIHQA